jgi:hypothetical protein
VTLWYKCLLRLVKILMAAGSATALQAAPFQGMPSVDQLQDFIIRTQRYLSLLAARTRVAERELRLAREAVG